MEPVLDDYLDEDLPIERDSIEDRRRKARDRVLDSLRLGDLTEALDVYSGRYPMLMIELCRAVRDDSAFAGKLLCDAVMMYAEIVAEQEVRS